MFRKTLTSFRHFESHIRGFLSRNPILYASVAGIGIILVWRGVWHTADQFPSFTGPISFAVGFVILVFTGAFVSSFVGKRVIMDGLRGENNLSEKTGRVIEGEISEENIEMRDIRKTLSHIEEELGQMMKKD